MWDSIQLFDRVDFNELLSECTFIFVYIEWIEKIVYTFCVSVWWPLRFTPRKSGAPLQMGERFSFLCRVGTATATSGGRCELLPLDSLAPATILVIVSLLPSLLTLWPTTWQGTVINCNPRTEGESNQDPSEDWVLLLNSADCSWRLEVAADSNRKSCS